MWEEKTSFLLPRDGLGMRLVESVTQKCNSSIPLLSSHCSHVWHILAVLQKFIKITSVKLLNFLSEYMVQVDWLCNYDWEWIYMQCIYVCVKEVDTWLLSLLPCNLGTRLVYIATWYISLGITDLNFCATLSQTWPLRNLKKYNTVLIILSHRSVITHKLSNVCQNSVCKFVDKKLQNLIIHL